MELVYLWVRKHKNIKEQGFNFSSKFECDFIGNFRHQGLIDNNFILKVKKKNYIENLYGENINLTAIVGENGVGKSTLLEILANEYNPTEFKNIFFIFFDSSINRLNLYGLSKGNFSYIELDELSDEIEKFNVSLKGDGINLVNSMKTIYYSNILNENNLYMNEFKERNDYSYTLNISTTFLLNQRKLIETNIYAIGAESKTNFDKIYRSFRIQQIQNAIPMIKAQLIDIPFRLPEKLVIKNIDFMPHIENLLDSIKDENSQKYKVYKKIIDIIRFNNTEEKLFRNYLSTNIVISFLLELLPYPEEYTKRYFNEILRGKETSSLDDFYNKVKNIVLELNNNSLWHIDFVEKFFENSEKILSFLSDKGSVSNDKYLIELDISTEKFDFLNAYLEIINHSEFFLDISWRGISSGEETFLYQFSTFYYLSKGYGDSINLRIENEEAKNLIILIDEGEITLHPQWQRDYIDNLVKFLRKIFTQNIHIILTTHSPFILSDIPNDNVIFLNKYKSDDKEVMKGLKEEGQCQVLKDGIDEKTFGANIHTLLSNGFFMKEGLIGKFAKTKIKDVFDYLEKRVDNISMTKEEIKLLIDSLGEVVLRNKLTELYNSFFSIKTKEEEYLEEIKKLKEENKRLKNVSN